MLSWQGSSLLEQEDLLKPLSITDQRFDWIRHDVASFGACTVTLSTSEAHGHITSFKTYIDQACGAPVGIFRIVGKKKNNTHDDVRNRLE